MLTVHEHPGIKIKLYIFKQAYLPNRIHFEHGIDRQKVMSSCKVEAPCFTQNF